MNNVTIKPALWFFFILYPIKRYLNYNVPKELNVAIHVQTHPGIVLYIIVLFWSTVLRQLPLTSYSGNHIAIIITVAATQAPRGCQWEKCFHVGSMPLTKLCIELALNPDIDTIDPDT